jgi:carbamate kinase
MTPHRATNKPLAVLGLGGNALVQRGEVPSWSLQLGRAQQAARHIAELADQFRLIVTHGNGPQIGMLAALNDDAPSPLPLFAVGAETDGLIGTMLELALRQALPKHDCVTVLTNTVVSADDPAFQQPTKPIGAVFSEQQAVQLTANKKWVMQPDGAHWRRVVPSPEPQRFLQLESIAQLTEDFRVVICAGGGGIPVVEQSDGSYAGVEAVVDKDSVSALLATNLDADTLMLLTDVPGVMRGYGTAQAELVRHLSVQDARLLNLPRGSMGPKVEACCRFVDFTGRSARITSLETVAQNGMSTLITKGSDR